MGLAPEVSSASVAASGKELAKWAKREVLSEPGFRPAARKAEEQVPAVTQPRVLEQVAA
jgi:hypothetical protein